MSVITSTATQSELAFACYANLQIADNVRGNFTSNDSGVPPALADSLAAHYRVLDILNDPLTGAYAVVFEDKSTGARTLAIRGTSDGLDVLNDVHLLAGIPANLNLQYRSLAARVSQWQSAGVINSATTLTGHSLGGYLIQVDAGSVTVRAGLGRGALAGDAGQDRIVIAGSRTGSNWKATKDRKSTRLNSSHIQKSRMPSSA